MSRKERQFYCEESFKISSTPDEEEEMDIDTTTVVTPSTKTASHRLVLNASHRVVQNASHSITNADNECEIVDKDDAPLLLKRDVINKPAKNNVSTVNHLVARHAQDPNGNFRALSVVVFQHLDYHSSKLNTRGELCASNFKVRVLKD